MTATEFSLSNFTDSSGNVDILAAAAAFRRIDWKSEGVADAKALRDDELAECGYSNPNSNSTPWSDSAPVCAGELRPNRFDELSEAEEKALEEAVKGAADAYNEGFIEAEEEAIERITEERKTQLRKADELGWRICQFGLPGASIHVVRVAPPGKANEISEEIFNPGPCGPYDSCIFKPSECADDTYRDGTMIYEDEIDEILASI